MFDNEALMVEAVKQGSYPQYLYKYRDISDRTKKIFGNGEFWFATPESFNDPFDCNLSETHDINIDDLKKYLSTLAIEPKDVDRYIELNKDDPIKIRQMVVDIKNEAFNNKGILSLSRNPKNILMWSHYAKKHTGLVICLDILADPSFFLKPMNIEYVDSYTESNYLKNAYKSTNDSLSLKSNFWRYEEEVRIYKKSKGNYNFNKDVITKVYFGVKTEQKDIDEITQICNDSGYKNIKFYKSHIKHAKFEIDCIEI